MEIREKIVTTAADMFISLGVKNVTMDALSSRLNMSKRTLYEHFKDKNELAIECIVYLISQTHSENLQIINDSSNVVEAMYFIMQKQNQRRAQMPEVFKNDLEKYFALAKTRTLERNSKENILSPPMALLEKGIKEGIFRNDLRLDLVDSYIFEMVTLVHESKLISMLKPNDEEVMNSIILPYFRGLCTPKGAELMHRYFDKETKKME